MVKKYKLYFEFSVAGTKIIEAKNDTEANSIADRLQQEVDIDDVEITSCEVECSDFSEIKR